MQIEQLLKPIEPPPGGLLKLQQALYATSKPRFTPAWRWHTAWLCSVGLLWFGSAVYDAKNQALVANLDTDISRSLLELMSTNDAANEALGQGPVVEMPGSNPQVKMFWLMADG